MAHQLGSPPPLPTGNRSGVEGPPKLPAASDRSPPPASASGTAIAEPPCATVIAPPVNAQVAPPPVARPLFAWWPMAYRVSRQLGRLVGDWQLEIRARLAGFSMSMALHAAAFLALSLILIPARRDLSGPGLEGSFRTAIDTTVPGPTDHAGSADGVTFSVANPNRSGEKTATADAGPQLAPGALAEDVSPPAAAEASEATASEESATMAASADAPLEVALRPASASAAGAGPGQPASREVASAVAGNRPGGDSPNAADAASAAASNAPNGHGGGFEGRDPARRGEMLARYGGTFAGERAVALGLNWLATHQREDGSWHFNHQDGRCNGYCPNPGTFASNTAATGLALLPFLGAGYTHKSGEYRETVRRGIFYLADQMLVEDDGGDLRDGSMYGQGLAAIALCENFALSRDPEVAPYAQAAIDFIVHAQDRNAGGWRYAPRTPGDTTVTGWQLMALKSGMLAGLTVPTSSFDLTSQFLDSVAADYGAGYGYLKPGRGPTTTAVGVLGRMLTGWPRDVPELSSGVRRLDKLGPSENDMYFNYNATQVMRHYGGEIWDRWNKRLRDRLIASQQQGGHAAGSWYSKDEHGLVGGRLYMTALSIMTLEVYYRHMPLYGERATSR